jgi:protein TonB
MLEASAARRAGTLGAVALGHVLLLALLAQTGTIPPLLPMVLPVRMLPAIHPPPPPPPAILPRLADAPPMAVPLPEIRLAAPPPPQPTAPRAITRAVPRGEVSHFGAATDAGLGMDVATEAGGGAGARGSLAGFEAAVRRQVLAARHQPALAWDRRNTCVVNYTVRVSASGGLAGLSIDPCAIPEINEAARDAIRAAAPFPPPPRLGAATADVHGSLIFHP